MKGWHVTSWERLCSILKHGLLPRDSARHNYPGEHANAGVEAVFVWTNWADVERWARPEEVVLAVDIAGLPSEPDPYYDDYPGEGHKSARRVLAPISPRRIRGVA